MRTTLGCVTWRASSSSRLNRRSISAAVSGSGERVRPDHFQGKRDFQFRVPCLIHGAHAAHAEQLDDVVAVAEPSADSERPARRLARGHRGGRNTAAHTGRRDLENHGRAVRQGPRRRRRSRHVEVEGLAAHVTGRGYTRAARGATRWALDRLLVRPAATSDRAAPSPGPSSRRPCRTGPSSSQ